MKNLILLLLVISLSSCKEEPLIKNEISRLLALSTFSPIEIKNSNIHDGMRSSRVLSKYELNETGVRLYISQAPINVRLAKITEVFILYDNIKTAYHIPLEFNDRELIIELK